MNKPKILFLDIETAPNLSYVWGRYEQNVIDVEHDWFILSFAYKWRGEKKVHVLTLKNCKSYASDPWNDEELVCKMAEIIEKADMVVTHNGDHFDLRKIRARMLVHDVPPLPDIKSFDTCKVARKVFGFDSNRLDELGRILRIGRKEESGGFSTWKGCLSGDNKAWKKMAEYNAADVELLEKVYDVMKVWDSRHINSAVVVQNPNACPVCLSEGHMQRRGFSYTKSGRRQRFQCSKCSAWRHGPHEKLAEAIAT